MVNPCMMDQRRMLGITESKGATALPVVKTQSECHFKRFLTAQGLKNLDTCAPSRSVCRT